MPRTARHFWVIAHRWAGLTIALFLIVAGTTGTLLAFYDELYAASAPWTKVEPPRPGARTLDPLLLNQAARTAAPPGYVLNGYRLGVEPDEVLSIGLDPVDPADPYLDAAVDPYTGHVVRLDEWGRFDGRIEQIMPFIYQLHYKLALGEIGLWAFGIAALIWTLDCFVGFYLTLPPTLWRGWGKSWRVRWTASPTKLNFDLHRAGGLWLWPVLLVLAWSSVAMNLREVYDPVMTALGAENVYEAVPVQPAMPNYRPDLDRAYRQADTLLATESRRQGFVVTNRNYLYFDLDKRAYFLSFATDRDFASKGNWSMLAFSVDGRLLSLTLAEGALHPGAADNWLLALHMAQVGGLPYRIFVSILGLLITMLSVTGVIFWMKKRSGRIARAARPSAVRSYAASPVPAE